MPSRLLRCTWLRSINLLHRHNGNNSTSTERRQKRPWRSCLIDCSARGVPKTFTRPPTQMTWPGRNGIPSSPTWRNSRTVSILPNRCPPKMFAGITFRKDPKVEKAACPRHAAYTVRTTTVLRIGCYSTHNVT